MKSGVDEKSYCAACAPKQYNFILFRHIIWCCENVERLITVLTCSGNHITTLEASVRVWQGSTK